MKSSTWLFFEPVPNTSLYEDGLYVDSGIVNLQNTFISPVAFSDARLNHAIVSSSRKRGKIIVDANDERHFTLLLLENPVRSNSDQE